MLFGHMPLQRQKANSNNYEYDPGELHPEQVEIKVRYCGICHSDLSMLNNDWGMSANPLVPGHEIVGEVVAVGEQARNVKIGDVVGVGWYSQSCMTCSSCLSGDHNLCATSESTIVGRHGGFADRVRAHWGWVNRLPEDLDVSKADA